MITYNICLKDKKLPGNNQTSILDKMQTGNSYSVPTFQSKTNCATIQPSFTCRCKGLTGEDIWNTNQITCSTLVSCYSPRPPLKATLESQQQIFMESRSQCVLLYLERERGEKWLKGAFRKRLPSSCRRCSPTSFLSIPSSATGATNCLNNSFVAQKGSPTLKTCWEGLRDRQQRLTW